MAILSYPTATGPMGAEAYCRTQYILSGEDKIRSGLKVTWYANRTVQITAGSGVVGGIAFTSTATELHTSDLEPSQYFRWDRLVARKKWPSLEVELVILKGAPGPNPSMPALTREFGNVWEFGLGSWIVADSNQNTIANGKVYGHYADLIVGQRINDRYVGGGGDTGAPLLVYANSDVGIPGAAKVKLKVLVSMSAEQAGLYSLTLQMLGKSEVVTFQVDFGGENLSYPHMLTVPAELEADMPPNGGTAAFIVQMNAAPQSGPVDIRHFYARLSEVMP